MVGRQDGSIRFVGTATTLIRLGEVTLLTDPNFLHRGQRASLGYGLWSKRRTEPALQPEDLPPLDAVLLSHLHGDHFDRVARRSLRGAAPVLTTPAAARVLHRSGFETEPLATWQATTVTAGSDTVTVTALPAVHARGVLGALLPPVMGSMLEWSRGGDAVLRLYVSGDTLLGDHLAEIARRYPDIDLALVHLGGTRVLGRLVTMDGEQGVRALEIVRPRVAVPIHYDDYGVFRSPLGDFLDAAAAAGERLGSRIVPLGRGDRLPLAAPTSIR